ncbi:hypothetical protein EMIHUDRAFT_458259, partial [Emiliania huxleyi CCMP1516]|uniref:SMP-LTD domain-containing protein n=2 Tax=Emiliania huxleyi TaxID=2903 RepID=A0A0D3JEM7_EMIH1
MVLCFLAALGQNGLDGLSLRPFSLATPRGGGLFGQTNFPDFGAAWNPSSRDEGGSTDSEDGLMVSGLSVQDVHSAHHRTGNASLPPGFAAALDGIGFRVHLDSFEAPPLGAASASRGSGLATCPGAALSVRLVVDGTAAYPPPLRVPHFGLELPPHGLSLSVWRETSLGFSLETDLQPFIALILSLLHDVLLEQVSTAVAESAVSESELFCEWVRQQMGPKQLGGDGSDFILSPPLPEPPSPYPRGDTLVWRDVAGGLLVTLNSERGLGGFSLQEAAAAGHLLGEHGKGQLRLPLWEIDLAQRIPTLTDPVVGASLRLAPAYLELGGLHTLNQLALAKPRGRSTEPYSLEFGLGFRELTVELRFNLSIALPEAGPDSLLYHAKSAPLAQQLKLSLSLSNLSASAIAFAPLSTDELFATPWLYLTPACLLRPLRVASLRQLLLSLSPDVIRLGEDPLYEIYRPEIEARLYGLVSDAIDFLDANYVSPDAIAALTSGPLLNMVNGLLPSAFDWLTGDCEPPPTPPPPPAPVEWCRAPLVQLAESELTARLVNTLFEALGLGDVSVHGAVSVPLDGAWLGPVTIEVSEPRLENLDQLSELKLLAADCAEPTTLRSTIGLGSA